MEQDSSEQNLLAGTERLTGAKPGALLSPEAQAAIEQARITNVVAAAIASLSWGASMSGPMRRAFAEYCRRYDVDPVTEMENLGGSPYVNADWFKRKLGELRMAGIVKDVTLEHIHADPRLDALRQDKSAPDEVREEASKRWFAAQFKRIAHNVPEKAEAVCLCTITLVDGGAPIVGCKWAGNGTSVRQPRTGGDWRPNPIAENNPTLFVESSSIRRAAIQLFSHLTGQRMNAPDPTSMHADHERLMSELSVSSKSAQASDAELTPKMISAASDGAYGLT